MCGRIVNYWLLPYHQLLDLGDSSCLRLRGFLTRMETAHRKRSWHWIVLFHISFCLLVTPSMACNIAYSTLGDSQVQDSATCGSASSLPCHTIRQALINSATHNGVCTEVRLQPSAYDDTIDCEELDSLENVTIDGSRAGTIPLKLANCSKIGNGNINSSAWLHLWNSTNIKVQYLNVSLANFTGSTAVKLSFSVNIVFQHSRFGYPMINTSSIGANQTLALKVVDCEFYGRPYTDPFLRETLYPLPQYRLAPIFFNQTCLLICDENTPGDRRGICCDLPENSQLPRLSLLHDFDVWLLRSSFYNMGITSDSSSIVSSLYASTSRYQDATAVHMGIEACSRLRAIVESCHFTNLTSPYDTVLKLFAGPQTLGAQYTIIDSTFLNGRGYIGGAVFLRIDPGSLNTTLVLRNSTFVNNTAEVEGGALTISYGLTQFATTVRGNFKNFAFIDGCHFIRNQAGGLLRNSAGGAVAAISPDFYAAVVNIAQEIPTIKVSNSLFANNTASYASAIFISGMALDLSST